MARKKPEKQAAGTDDNMTQIVLKMSPELKRKLEVTRAFAGFPDKGGRVLFIEAAIDAWLEANELAEQVEAIIGS